MSDVHNLSSIPHPGVCILTSADVLHAKGVEGFSYVYELDGVIKGGIQGFCQQFPALLNRFLPATV